MTLRTRIIVTCWLSASMLPATVAAQVAAIVLGCQGEMEVTTDNRIEKKSLAVDVLLDVTERRAKFSDMWGCLADMGSSDSRSGICISALPVSVSDQEVTFFKEQTNERYTTTTSFALNRYSGRLSVRSSAIALPAAQAKWTVFLLNANLACAPLAKKF
jgi:hypothetical protein